MPRFYFVQYVKFPTVFEIIPKNREKIEKLEIKSVTLDEIVMLCSNM